LQLLFDCCYFVCLLGCFKGSIHKVLKEVFIIKDVYGFFFLICIVKKLPPEIKILNFNVQVVDSFKLLGITIDNKLNFYKYNSELRSVINKKMFSIKRLFYLNTSVKIQFFKTFLLPYFDYCLSLYIYFPKFAIQIICNIYTICLYKLFKFKLEHNNLLDEAFLDDEIESTIEEQEIKLIQKRKRILVNV
jgi:hypothetical protein